jgi:hypothetical protein
VPSGEHSLDHAALGWIIYQRLGPEPIDMLAGGLAVDE